MGLGVLEKKVLLLDVDPQLTLLLELDLTLEKLKNGVYECLIGKVKAKDIILETKSPNLYLLPTY